MILTFISSLTCFNHHQKFTGFTPSLPCMLKVHIYVRHLGLCHYLWCVIVHNLYSSKKNKEQTAVHIAAECKMNKKMPGLSTSSKTIIIWVYNPHRIRTCVKIPYNLAKFDTVKFLKNFNVKISMKFSRQENFMKFSITTYSAAVIGRQRGAAINHRCAVGLLPLLREEFWLLKLILHSELRRRAASRRALPCPSSYLWAMINTLSSLLWFLWME